MEDEAVDLVDTQTVPNLYAVRLHRDDYRRFEPVRRQLTDELQRYLTRMASQRGYRLAGRVRVRLEPGELLRTGNPEIVARFEQPRQAGAAEDSFDAPHATRRFSVGPGPAPSGPRLELAGRSHAIDQFPFVLGRGEQVDLQVMDPRVSRRHAEINRFGGEYRVQDLGSRNGTRVNGVRVESAALADGDRVSLGGLELTFRA
jgi:hypothetical protein